jgi:hypothetical protein
LVSTTKRPTLRLLSARSPIDVSASVTSCLSVWFCVARLASTLSVSRSAGLARRTTSLMSSRAAADAGAELVEDDPSRSR